MEGFDRALVCRNGHVINSTSVRFPEHNDKFCSTCGAEAVSTCTGCAEPIRGFYWGGEPTFEPWVPPAHCHNCGKRFPWTEARLRAISDLLALTDASDADKAALAGAVPALAAESPSTPVAVATWQKFLRGPGRQLASGFRDLIVQVAGAAVSAKLFGP